MATLEKNRSPSSGSSPGRSDPQTDLFPDAENIIEADSDPSEGYGTDTDSAPSTSLASSVRDHVFENNRRFHKFKEGRYLLPNDEPEQEREDMKHAMVVHVCDGKLHFAPLLNPQKVLDIGTGTGAWAIDSKTDIFSFRGHTCLNTGIANAANLCQWAMNIPAPRLLA